MIQIERTEVYGWESAIHGMRNPMNSWDKSDSVFKVEGSSWEKRDKWHISAEIGEKDLTLMKQLVRAGTDHSKFMRMITVTCDIVAPLYWWKEFDTYKVGTVRNSCSTMHKIQEKEFSLSDFSVEHLYNDDDNPTYYKSPIRVMSDLCECLNYYRERYLDTKDKKDWWQLIQLLPSSYNQRATVQLNYAVLQNMYHSRKNHKLDEWHDFCDWISGLPYHELITMKPEEPQNGETITIHFKGKLVSET